MSKLGKYFRRRYENLLKDETDPKDLVYVESSDLSRTIESAKSCIDGFFPQTDNSGLNWAKKLLTGNGNKIKINRIPKDLDSKLWYSRPCIKHKREVERIKKKQEYLDLLKSHKSLFRELRKNSGLAIRTFDDVFRLYDTLKTEKLRNLT